MGRRLGSVELTILRYEKAYMQQLDYGSDEMPKLYKTAAQAEADGLIPFGGHEVGYVSYAEAVVLVKQQYELQNIQGEPSQQFTEEFGDDRYAIALWRITGTAYKHAAKKIMGMMRTTLKERAAHRHHQGRSSQGKRQAEDLLGSASPRWRTA
jgi:hypothetical protein